LQIERPLQALLPKVNQAEGRSSKTSQTAQQRWRIAQRRAWSLVVPLRRPQAAARQHVEPMPPTRAHQTHDAQVPTALPHRMQQALAL
jgi:hypothetical protein